MIVEVWLLQTLSQLNKRISELFLKLSRNAGLRQSLNGPVMLLEFDKKPIPTGNLARTFDLRHVVVCGPKGMEVFDWTGAPDPVTGGRVHKVLWRTL